MKSTVNHPGYHQSADQPVSEERKEFEALDKQTTVIIMVSILGGIPSAILLCCLLRVCCAQLREKKVTNKEEEKFVHPLPAHPPPLPRHPSTSYSGFCISREGDRPDTVTPSFIKTAFAYNSMNQKLGYDENVL